MSILETFYILFKTDAEGAADSVKKLATNADRAEDATEGVDKALKDTKNSANAAAAATTKVATATAAADANAKRMAASFMAAARSLVAPVLAFASVTGLAGVATARAANIRQLDQFAAKLNSTVADVDAFQRSVQELGGEGAAALDSMVKLGEKVNEAFADRESGAAKDFAAWGLAFKDAEGNALGASDAMLELAGSIENLSQAEALARIKKLGIEDAATIELLLRGRRAVEENIAAQKEMGVVTEAQAKATREYYGELGGLRNRLTSLGNAITGAVLPGITAGIERLSRAFDWMGKNRRLVEGFFIGVATAVTAYFLPAMARAALAVAAATWPFLAIAAAAAGIGVAFALAYEDVRAFMDGQPSLVGELAERYAWFAQIVEGVGYVFQWLQREWVKFVDEVQQRWDALSSLFNDFVTVATEVGRAVAETLAPLGEAWGELAEAVGSLVETIFGVRDATKEATATGDIEAFRSVLETIAPVVTAIADAFRVVLGGAVQFVSGVVSGLAQGVERIRNAIAGIGAPDITPGQAAAADAVTSGQRGGLRGALRQSAVAEGQAVLGSAANAPQALATGSSNTTVSQTSNVSVGNVTVNTQATDAAGVARAVRGELSNQLRNTAAGFDDGVAR